MKVTDRIYEQKKVITFSSTKGKFGGLSNMAPGYSLFVNEINIPNSEALYQACRFPLFPDIQEEIISKKSPMDAKKISRKYIKYTRQDWESVKFDIMRWSLKIKLIQNNNIFRNLLKLTNNEIIVEFSKKDKIWGATPTTIGCLEGKNALGRLLMELRHNYIVNNNELNYVEPLNIPAFILFNNQIEKVYSSEYNLVEFNEFPEYELA